MGNFWIWKAVPGVLRVVRNGGSHPDFIWPYPCCRVAHFGIADAERGCFELYLPGRCIDFIVLHSPYYNVFNGSLCRTIMAVFLYPAAGRAVSVCIPAREKL